jgi:hypothetical protein
MWTLQSETGRNITMRSPLLTAAAIHWASAQVKHQNIFLCIHNRNDDFSFYPIKTLKKGIVSEDDLNLIFNKLELKNRTIITDSEPSMKASLKNLDGVNHLTFKSYEIKEGIMKQRNMGQL